MYLAGNTDFSLAQAPEGEECCHNAKLLVDDAGTYFAIPYDFDGSGYVDASYAAPPSAAVGIASNRRRAYRGYCDSIDSINAQIEILKASRERINSIISDETHVSPREANRSHRYVDDFFEILDNARQLDRRIVRECRG